MTKELCDIKELSNYLKVSIPEIRKLVRERRIPNLRIGKMRTEFLLMTQVVI